MLDVDLCGVSSKYQMDWDPRSRRVRSLVVDGHHWINLGLNVYESADLMDTGAPWQCTENKFLIPGEESEVVPNDLDGDTDLKCGGHQRMDGGGYKSSQAPFASTRKVVG